METILEEAERRVADKSARMCLHEIIEDMTAAHVAYMQFVAAKVGDTRFFTKQQVPGSSAGLYINTDWLSKLHSLFTVQYRMLEKLSLVRLTEVLQRLPLPIVEQKVGENNSADVIFALYTEQMSM